MSQYGEYDLGFIALVLLGGVLLFSQVPWSWPTVAIVITLAVLTVVLAVVQRLPELRRRAQQKALPKGGGE